MAYATLEELQSGWRELNDVEVGRAEVVLERASTWLDFQTGGRFADRDITSAEQMLLSDTVCALTRRAIGEASPVTTEPEWTQVASPYEQTFIPAAQVGEFYLTKWEKRALGISGGVGTLEMC